LDEAQLIRDGRHVRQRIADPGAALAVAGEARDRRQHGLGTLAAGHGAEATVAANLRRNLAAAPALHARLVVEQIDVRRCAVLEQVDDALGLAGEVRQTRQAVAARLGEWRWERPGLVAL